MHSRGWQQGGVGMEAPHEDEGSPAADSRLRRNFALRLDGGVGEALAVGNLEALDDATACLHVSKWPAATCHGLSMRFINTFCCAALSAVIWARAWVSHEGEGR